MSLDHLQYLEAAREALARELGAEWDAMRRADQIDTANYRARAMAQAAAAHDTSTDVGLSRSSGDVEVDKLGTAYKRSELAELPSPTPRIEGIIDYPSAVVMPGSYGVGKTAVALSMAASVATGLPWLGRSVEQAKVLYVVGEGAYGLDNRLRAWEDAWNQGRPIPDDQLEIRVKPSSMGHRDVWQQLSHYAEKEGVRFVVLDTLSSLAWDADETKDAAKIMRWLSDVAALTNGTALLVHHPGWSDTGRVRGGYQFEANVDQVLLLKGAEHSDLIELTMKKEREKAGGNKIWLRRRVHAGSIIIEGTTSSAVDVPVRQRILQALDNCGPEGATGNQLQEELDGGGGRSNFYKQLNHLVEDGEATVTDGRPRRYFRAGRTP